MNRRLGKNERVKLLVSNKNRRGCWTFHCCDLQPTQKNYTYINFRSLMPCWWFYGVCFFNQKWTQREPKRNNTKNEDKQTNEQTNKTKQNKAKQNKTNKKNKASSWTLNFVKTLAPPFCWILLITPSKLHLLISFRLGMGGLSERWTHEMPQNGMLGCLQSWSKLYPTPDVLKQKTCLKKKWIQMTHDDLTWSSL